MNLLNRRRPTATPTTRDNFDPNCGSCIHSWHGMACRAHLCNCPTSWTEPGQ